MKNLIVYASVHHGNTKKLVDAIASECDVEIVNSVEVKEKDLSEYDMIGFASGIYGANFHQSILSFAEANLPADKKVFFIMTSAMNKDFSKSIMKVIGDKNPTVVGLYTCTGYNTFGPFKLMGGTGKGHPDEKDIADAVAFYKGLEA